jgi:tetratricopeptide (TPR) repeat protein
MRLGAAAALALAALICASAGPAQTSGDAAQPKRIFESRGTLSGAADDPDGALLLTLWDHHVRFRLPAQPEGGLDKLAAIVRLSNERGESMRVLYDAQSGRVNEETATVDYPLCRVALGDLVFEPATPCATTPLPGAPASAEAALALGYAYSTSGEIPRAQALLARADAPGDRAFRKLLLQIRGDAAAASADGLEGAAADRAHLAALTDYRALASLEPDDVEVQFLVASALEELGGYQDAKAIYDEILRRWPEEDYRIAVRIGALYRIQGDNVRALEQLDSLVARKGPQPGMKFHYHRGWTLTRLGRFAEAVAEFDAGLREQPDYAYAYFRRSCAKASMGGVAEALSDAERGRALLAGLPTTDKAVAFDIHRTDEVIAQLKRAQAVGGNRPVLGTCGGYSGHYETGRPRSPLLPAA